jgi:outer membrane protein
MRKTIALSAAAVAMACWQQPVLARDNAARWQVKLLGSAVLPDGKLDKVKFAVPSVAGALPSNVETKADDNFVPTVAVEYFFTPNLSVETICCVTQHDVDGRGALNGARLVSNAKIIPATFTAKYHLNAGAIKPYIGAGPAYFIFFDEKPGATAQALGAARAKIDNSLGFALQAGIDIPVGASGLGVTLDAKRYFLSADAKWYDAGGAKVLHTRQTIDPWILSAGLAWRF